jgi:hypothetical protein
MVIIIHEKKTNASSSGDQVIANGEQKKSAEARTNDEGELKRPEPNTARAANVLTADLLTAAERKKTRAAPVVNNMMI